MITAHPVAPEELMALLDGELSAAEAQTVSTHIEHCTDCAKIVDQLQSTSRSLTEWKVDPVPMRLEKSVSDSIAKINSGFKISEGNLFVRSSFWTRKQWAIASGGALAAVVLVVTISVPNLLRSRQPASAAYYYSRQLDTDSLSGSTAGKLQADQRTRKPIP